MRFDKIIVIGSGKIAGDCLQYLLSILPKNKLCAIETSDSSLSMLESICRKENLPFEAFSIGGAEMANKIENAILNTIDGYSSLIVSANNRFIFTPAIIHSVGTEIINFHYALLPHYRGVNIPTWVIFNREKKTGITWHFVNEQIDRGRIIIQKEIDILESMTAFDITRIGMKLALETFKDFIEDLLEHEIVGVDVDYPDDEPAYRSSVLPMDGILDLNMSMDDILRLLRSFDYRGADVVPKLKLEYKGEHFRVDKYKVKECECEGRMIEKTGNKLWIRNAGKEIVLMLLPNRG